MKKIAPLLLIFAPLISLAEPQSHDLISMMKILLKGQPQYIALKPYMDGASLLSAKDALNFADKSFPADPRNYGKIYRGQVKLSVDGKPLIADSLAVSSNWTVYAAGPNAAPAAIFFKGDPVKTATGQSFFTKAGIKLSPIACKVIDPNNYDAFYLTPIGKSQGVLQISKSTGSGGMWYSYAVFWNGPLVSELPQDVEVGDCRIND